MEQSELPHFHFNEALLKPFENLLSMETCDIDVQDQIVACLYEIVEAHRSEIRSGWKPLFGTLRNARNRPLHVTNVTDIFRVFLDSDNTLVFANAGLDCILCLLSYLEVNGGCSSNSSSYGSPDDDNLVRPTEFVHETLKYLERCSSILGFMYDMPKCPNLHSTYKIKGISYTHVIDANIPNSMENFTYFGNDFLQNNNEKHMISYRSLHIDKESITKIDELDKSSGVLKVWFLLLDGLTNSLIMCPVPHQGPILHCIFKLFKQLLNSPGIDFGLYCINHLLIPMIQDWLRYVNKTQRNWTSIEKNFKHSCGMATDLVVEFIERAAELYNSEGVNKDSEQEKGSAPNLRAKCTNINRPVNNLKFAQMRTMAGNQPHYHHYIRSEALGNASGGAEGGAATEHNNNTTSGLLEDSPPSKIPKNATLALKQLLLVLIECSAQAQESVARVGVSCLKHVIMSTGHLLNKDHWLVACSAIHRACTVTIAPLRQLGFAFHEKSNSFYGDCATVKVAARKDSTVEELLRVYTLAQQVFLMDGQRESVTNMKNIDSNKMPIIDERSYAFLLNPLPNGYGHNMIDNFVIRIPYKNLVIGLLANQILLQLCANLLLGNLKVLGGEIPGGIFENGHIQAVSSPTLTVGQQHQGQKQPKNDFELGYRSREILLRCIKQYITAAMEFDSRPGLKFLMQKVSNLDFAANLYKQMSSAWIIYFITLVDVYLSDIQSYNLSVEDLRYILESCSRVNTQTVKKKENFVRYLFALQDAWILICEEYLVQNQQQQQQQQREKEKGSPRGTPQLETRVHLKGTPSVENGLNPETNPFYSDCYAQQLQAEQMNASGDGSSDESPSSPRKVNNSNDTSPTTKAAGVAPRKNPFDTNNRYSSAEFGSVEASGGGGGGNQSISPEIEQQRNTSISNDAQYKRNALAQLVIASMELLKSLPEEAAEHLKVLLTPTIRSAFRLVAKNQNDINNYNYSASEF